MGGTEHWLKLCLYLRTDLWRHICFFHSEHSLPIMTTWAQILNSFMKSACNNAKLDAKPDPIMVILLLFMICYKSLFMHLVSTMGKMPTRKIHLTLVPWSWVRECSLGYQDLGDFINLIKATAYRIGMMKSIKFPGILSDTFSLSPN